LTLLFRRHRSQCFRSRPAMPGSALLLLSAVVATSSPAQQSTQDLTNISIENLMNIEVTSVSRKEQKLSRTASAVFVISQEDIRQSGATNIPDLLRMVPGMDVAQINASTWAISARGMNGQFSSDLLVMLDGRNVYTPSFGGVFWDTLDLPLENIERIEVIRGPGGSIWGENAVNGGVNIIQKKAGDSRGMLVAAGGGNTKPEFGTAQYGGVLGKRVDYRIYSKYFSQDEMDGVSRQDGGDGYHLLQGGFRADTALSGRDSLTFQGNLYSGREGNPTTALLSISSPRVNQELFLNVSGGFVQSIWNHTFSERSDGTLMASYDSYDRSDLLGDKRKTFNVDYTHHLSWGRRHQFVSGLGYRRTAENSDGTLEVSRSPPTKTITVSSLFVQDEIAILADRMYFTAGTKLEHNTYTGFALLPSARVVYEFNHRSMMWAGVSHAVRTPAETDVSLRLNILGFTGPDGTPVLISNFGNPHTKDEGVTAYEAGYRVTTAPNLSLDFAAYYNDYDNVISTEPVTPFFETVPPPPHLVLPSTNNNLIRGETHGAEIAAKWGVTKHWTLSPSFDFERIHMHRATSSQDLTTGPDTEGSDPHLQARLRSHIELPHRTDWNTAVYFTDRLLSQGVPSYTRLDSNFSWRWTEQVSFSLVGENLLKAQHLEFVDSAGATNSTLIRRSWYAKVTWHF
jgi:iron complex outermembrane recepter protein